MSGGYFDYDQHRMDNIAESIEQAIQDNHHGYSEETINRFKQAAETTRQAAKMVQRVDWLLSCDDGEDSFHKRWKEEILNKLYLTQAEAADKLGVTKITLAGWRKNGEGPNFIKVGFKIIGYRETDLINYINANVVNPRNASRDEEEKQIGERIKNYWVNKMILTVTNPNNIVQNAFFNQTDLAFNLFINTVDKWIRFDSYATEYGPDRSITWFYHNDEQPTPDTVELTAETNEDKEILSRMKFEQLNKDQMWILMLKESVYYQRKDD